MAHAVEVKVGAFPTGVGMNRVRREVEIDGLGVPHGRGDEPKKAVSVLSERARSPRAWG